MIPFPLTYQDKSARDEAICIGVAAGLHALLFLINPLMMRGNIDENKNPLVEIGIVEENPAYITPAAEPKKMSLMDTLKDMLSKPAETPHIAPQPMATKVAAPVQPTLQDRAMSRLASTFKPNQTMDDLANARTADQIQTNQKQFTMPDNAPQLQAKAFGGIRAKDLPFQVGGQDLSGGGASVPIAVGNKSAKAALDYSNPTLKNAEGTRLQSKTFVGGAPSDVASLGAGGARNIALSGTGGAGNAPTGVQTGAALQDKQGSGGLINKALLGGSRAASAPSLQTMPSAAAALDQQLSQQSTAKVAKNKGFEISGKLANRTIMKKIIPQYPSWAEEQGIIGTLRLYFTVTPEGTVRSNIKVTKTTGNPQLDQIGIDALKQWLFAAQPGSSEDDIQWGIITFTFSLAS